MSNHDVKMGVFAGFVFGVTVFSVLVLGGLFMFFLGDSFTDPDTLGGGEVQAHSSALSEGLGGSVSPVLSRTNFTQNITIVVESFGEDKTKHWAIVKLMNGTTQLDKDKFEWAKVQKRVLVNLNESRTYDPTNLTASATENNPFNDPKWIPRYEFVEGNRMEVSEMISIASRHFLKRQGIVQDSLNGSVFSPKSYTKISGDSIRLADNQTQRFSRINSSEYVVDVSVEGTLKPVNGHIGTVTVISVSADYWVYGNPSPSCFEWDLYYGHHAVDGGEYAIGMVNTSSIPATDTIDDVVLNVDKQSNQGSVNVKIQGYNQDGQTNPSGEACGTKATNSKNDPTPWYTGTGLDGAGNKTVDLGTGADSDLEAAIDVTSVFAFAITNGTTASGYNRNSPYRVGDAGTREMKLIITHSAGGDSTPPTFSTVNNNATGNVSGQVVNWTTTISDETALSYCWFTHNDSGTFTNQSVRTCTSPFTWSANVTITTNVGQVCGFFGANDTTNNHNVTSQSCFTIAEGADPCSCPDGSVWDLSGSTCSLSVSCSTTDVQCNGGKLILRSGGDLNNLQNSQGFPSCLEAYDGSSIKADVG